MKNFENFILESKGISTICITYRNTIFKDLEKSLISFDNINQKIYQDVQTFRYNLNDSAFPITNLIIVLNLYKYKENICNALSDVKNSIVLNNNIDSLRINFDIYINKLDYDFKFKIKSILLHELVHCYELYNIKIKNKSRPVSWSIGSILPFLRKTIKNKEVLNILDLLYKSIKNEAASQLHQYYDYKKDGKEYSEINDIINKLKSFKVDNISDDFIKDLELVRYHIFNSLKHEKNNINYLKDLDKSFWNKSINKENVNNFISDLKDLFNSSARYIEKKIILINKNLSEAHYGDENYIFEIEFLKD